jgi:magnesium-transporting ATPase (P-type)
MNRDRKEFEPCYWSEILVGDYVRVRARDSIPADLLIVSVSPASTDDSLDSVEGSTCYVETKSLDGETNLKLKNVLPVFLGGII